MTSWIDAFVEANEPLNSPKAFRLWTAISIISAVLEQKVWIQTTRRLHANMYIMLVAGPGIGKTRTIIEGREYLTHLPEPHLSPISMTFASLVDSLVKSKRIFVHPEGENLEYNSMFICVDELGAFITKYDNDMIDGLSAFYNATPYSQTRRTGDVNIKIQSPQVGILCGSTPQNLMQLMPDKAWGQGFTSRLVMVYSDDKVIADDFANEEPTFSEDLLHDILMINNITGRFTVTDEYKAAVKNWQLLGEVPVPGHPKLMHYIQRRRAHLYKLSMVSAIDRSNALILTVDDFNRAMGWLLDAEANMEDIFKAGATNVDAQAMDEILHFIKITDKGKGVSEAQITKFARDKVPLNSILRVVEVLERSGQITLRGVHSVTKFKHYSVPEGQ